MGGRNATRGCLHYGLERYEEALEWFKRIIDLDARYGLEIVLLLCLMRDANFPPLAVMSRPFRTSQRHCTALNKQEEAEQHWIRAVKLRPQLFRGRGAPRWPLLL